MISAATPLARDDFAVTESYVYLNHAAVGTLPKQTRTALDGFVDAQATGGIARLWSYESRMPEYRRRIARFVGAPDGSIAMLRNTGDGANAIAGGLDWRAGDEVLLPDDEFPANVHPWLTVRRAGATVRFVETARGRLTPTVLRAAMTPQTRVVTVSWVSFADGYRHDLAGLAEVAHAGGAIFCVDAIQGLGAFALDVDAMGIDALYCGGAKWMLALQGVSFLYVRPALLERLIVATPGWRSVERMWDFFDVEQAPAPDATRFEGGTPNFIGALAFAESIDVIERAGTAAIGTHILHLTDRLAQSLQECGAQVQSLRGESISSGIVTFTVPGRDPVLLGRALQEAGFVTTYRPSGIRVAPHGYNTSTEIDAFVDALRGII